MGGEIVTIGRATLIYGLCDERGAVRYVGKTVRTLELRLAQHRREAKRRSLPVSYWLRKHQASVRLLETVAPGDDWAARERYWIERFDNLLNLTKGGEGLAGHTLPEEHRSRIAAALRTGAHFNCLQCGARFWRKRNQIQRGQNKFCSRQCANPYNRGGHRG